MLVNSIHFKCLGEQIEGYTWAIVRANDLNDMTFLKQSPQNWKLDALIKCLKDIWNNASLSFESPTSSIG